MKFFRVFLISMLVIGVSFLSTKSYAGYSHGTRQTGKIILDELLTGSNAFIARVGSSGCTNKSSFKVDVKKEEGLSPKVPHYILTIRRIKPDYCKAIIEDGTLVLFNIRKDLGIKGDFTYSVSNQVVSSQRINTSDNSLFSIVKKHFSFSFPKSKEIRPEPYKKFVMEHDYFICLIPIRWKLEWDKKGCEKSGIFEIKVIKLDKEKEKDAKVYFLPDPMIYVGYYTKNNNQNKTYESFIMDYKKLAKKRKGSTKSKYKKPKNIKLAGKKAVEILYKVYQEVPQGQLFATKYWMKAKFIIINAESGFYVLAYKSPEAFYRKYLPVFDEVVKSFKPKK